MHLKAELVAVDGDSASVFQARMPVCILVCNAKGMVVRHASRTAALFSNNTVCAIHASSLSLGAAAGVIFWETFQKFL
jgi:hypothetical protein